MDRHFKPDKEGKELRLKKEVTLDLEFQELWNRIKQKTTFSTAWKLVQHFSEDNRHHRGLAGALTLPQSATHREVMKGSSMNGNQQKMSNSDWVAGGSTRSHLKITHGVYEARTRGCVIRYTE